MNSSNNMEFFAVVVFLINLNVNEKKTVSRVPSWDFVNSFGSTTFNNSSGRVFLIIYLNSLYHFVYRT